MSLPRHSGLLISTLSKFLQACTCVTLRASGTNVNFGLHPSIWRLHLLSPTLPRTLALLFLAFLPAAAMGEGLTIVSPASNRTVSSPVRVVAEFPNNSGIVSTTITVDGSEISGGSVTPLDVEVPIPAGDHFLTVAGLQADGSTVSASEWIKVAATTATAQSASISTSSTTHTYTNIEEKSGWYLYPDQGHPVCSSTPSLMSSPSVNAPSGKFYLGPTGQYNNCLWPIRLGSSTTVTHFQLDSYYRLSNPAYSQGIEFSSNHHIGTKWYKFSVQCSYAKGIFSVWDTAGGRWSATNIPCTRPALNSWDHLTVNTSISNGKAVFTSLNLNGVQHAINKSFYPSSKSSSYSYGVHFQMNGDLQRHPYYAYVDKLTYAAW